MIIPTNKASSRFNICFTNTLRFHLLVGFGKAVINHYWKYYVGLEVANISVWFNFGKKNNVRHK